MTTNIRRVSDVWKAIDHLRIAAKMKSREWKQSYAGVTAALKHVGLVMVTTEKEFAELPVPLQTFGAKKAKYYMDRKIRVAKNGIISAPTHIGGLISGASGLLTSDERMAINVDKSVYMRNMLPTGSACSNAVETNAIDVLDELLGTDRELCGEHLLENRLADKAYCLQGDNKTHSVFVPDQVKSSRAMLNGRVTFNAHHTVMQVKYMIEILRSGLSLTCIGFDHNGQLDVVWLFHGQQAISGLQTFDEKQRFSPRLHLKISSEAAKPFNKFINQYQYRFDVKDSGAERRRLLDRRIEIVRIGQKKTIEYLNEDDSQIPGCNHRIEQHAFALTRSACAKLGVDIVRKVSDGYGPVDFRLIKSEFECRIQDKSTNGQSCGLRPAGRHPYDPDSFDILQITNITTHQIYAIPMRVLRNGHVLSFLSSEQLMKPSITLSKHWQTAHADYLCDLSKDTGVAKYLDICTTAYQIPRLSDRSFYANMLRDNGHMFGSKKHRSKHKKTI